MAAVYKIIRERLANKQTLSKIKEACILLFILTIPLKVGWNSGMIILLTILFLLTTKLKESWRKVKANKMFYPLFGIYFLHLIGLIYMNPENSGRAEHFLVLLLSLVLFPFIASGYEITSKKVEQCLNVFLMVVTAIIIYCFASNYILFLVNGKAGDLALSDFIYEQLAKPLNIQPIYLSLYTSFGVLLVILKLFHIKRYSAIEKAGLISLIVLFLIFILFLGARTGILSLLITAAIIIFLHLGRKFNPTKVISVLLIALLGFALTVNLIPPVKKRFNQLTDLKPAREIKGNDWNGVTTRIAVWTAAYELIKEYPIIGVGTGDDREALLNKYREISEEGGNEFHKLIGPKYNSHNQYLQYGISFGLVGMLVFCSLFLNALYYSFKRKDLLALSFTLIFMLNAITEAVLYRQKGVVFLIFFYVLIFSRYSQNKEVVSPKKDKALV